MDSFILVYEMVVASLSLYVTPCTITIWHSHVRCICPCSYRHISHDLNHATTVSGSLSLWLVNFLTDTSNKSSICKYSRAGLWSHFIIFWWASFPVQIRMMCSSNLRSTVFLTPKGCTRLRTLGKAAWDNLLYLILYFFFVVHCVLGSDLCYSSDESNLSDDMEL